MGYQTYHEALDEAQAEQEAIVAKTTPLRHTPTQPPSTCLRQTATQQAARLAGTPTRTQARRLSATCRKCSA
jgi:hypothetical protein